MTLLEELYQKDPQLLLGRPVPANAELQRLCQVFGAALERQTPALKRDYDALLDAVESDRRCREGAAFCEGARVGARLAQELLGEAPQTHRLMLD